MEEVINKKAEYLLFEDNKHLIGKRAKFKDKENYTQRCWGKSGVIMHHEGSKYLSLKFDTPLLSGYKNGCKTESLFISPNSTELI